MFRNKNNTTDVITTRGSYFNFRFKTQEDCSSPLCPVWILVDWEAAESHWTYNGISCIIWHRAVYIYITYNLKLYQF